MTDLSITGFDAGICKSTDVYVAVDTTVMPNGQNKKYTLQQITTFIASEVSPLDFKGTWNAATNTPALTSGVGTAGDLYVVDVAGSTNLDGITTWTVGDWVLFNGTVWQRIEALNTGNVVGPASATNNAIVIFDGLTGNIIKNSVITISDLGVIQGAILPAIGNSVVAIALGTTGGDVIINAGVPPTVNQVLTAISPTEAQWSDNPSGDVTGPAGSTDNALACYNGTSGKIIKNSTVTLGVTGVVTGITIEKAGNSTTATKLATSGADVVIESASPPLAGQVLFALSPTIGSWQFLPGTGNVVGPASSSDSAIPLYDGITGKLLKNSQWTISQTFQGISGTTFTWASGADTANSDAFTFFFRQGVDPLQEALILNTNGDVNIPSSASFVAQQTVPIVGITGDGTIAVLTFNVVFFDRNNNFNAGSTFIAATDGIYYFLANIAVGDLGTFNPSIDANLNFYVNGIPNLGSQRTNLMNIMVAVGGQNQATMQAATMIELVAGSAVTVRLAVQGTGTTVSMQYGTFQGRLVN